MDNQQHYFKANIEHWNHRTPIHIDSEFYDVPSFKKGKNSLNTIELDLLGDLQGKHILHLQCHFGQDTLSLARMGAHVTGLDFSPEAIKGAELLAKELRVPANFICGNVLEVDKYVEETFDIVFASYGICGWLPDLTQWGELISQRLKKGGLFIIVDFHPALWMFDDHFRYLAYSYFNTGVIQEEINQTYTDGANIPSLTSYSWNHSLSEIISALISAGLYIEQFSEYDYSPYSCFQGVIDRPEGGYYIKGLEGKLPMVYALKCRKM